MTEWFVPAPVTQRTGSPCQWSDCWSATGAWLLSAATGGLSAVTPTAFRVQAGGGSGRVNPATGCHTGFESDVVKGLARLGVKGRIVKIPFAKVKDVIATERRAVFGIAVDYDAWPKNKTCQGIPVDPEVNHMVALIGGEPVRVMNPLCVGTYQEVAPARVLAAARKFAVEHGRTTIWLIRVVRPIPPGLPAAEARIAALEAKVADQSDAISEAQALLTQAQEALA